MKRLKNNILCGKNVLIGLAGGLAILVLILAFFLFTNRVDVETGYGDLLDKHG